MCDGKTVRGNPRCDVKCQEKTLSDVVRHSRRVAAATSRMRVMD